MYKFILDGFRDEMEKSAGKLKDTLNLILRNKPRLPKKKMAQKTILGRTGAHILGGSTSKLINKALRSAAKKRK